MYKTVVVAIFLSLTLACSSGSNLTELEIEATVVARVRAELADATAFAPKVDEPAAGAPRPTLVPLTATPRPVNTPLPGQPFVVENEATAEALRGTPTPSKTPRPTWTPRPYVPTTDLEIQSFNCQKETFGGTSGYAYVRGEVKNTSGRRLENIMAVSSWYTATGEFIVSDSALLDFNPIMPGQISPFETISTFNPLMKDCRLAFTKLFGATISSKLQPTRTPRPTRVPVPARTPEPVGAFNPQRKDCTSSPGIPGCIDKFSVTTSGDSIIEPIVFNKSDGTRKSLVWRPIDDREGTIIRLVTLDGEVFFEMQNTESNRDYVFDIPFGPDQDTLNARIEVDVTSRNPLYKIEVK